MKIYTLIENTKPKGSAFLCEHGLSLYFEHNKKRILFDTGSSDTFIYNATLLGIDLAKVDVDDRRVLRIGVSFEQFRLLHPLLHIGDTPLQGPGILISVGYHPLQQGDVGVEILFDRGLIQFDAAGRGRSLRRGIGQFKRLLNAQAFNTFDFKDAPGEGVYFALFLNGQ